jgi:hypothetical protein
MYYDDVEVFILNHPREKFAEQRIPPFVQIVIDTPFGGHSDLTHRMKHPDFIPGLLHSGDEI